MKIETHCHTLEGSPDGLVSIEKTIEILKEKEYEGMIVTDHNSYKGYERIKEKDHGGFVLIKGVEYDTSDAGHVLIILPEGVRNGIFTYRGMRVQTVIEIVRVLGGILGPAHPFDYYKLGMLNNTKWVRNVEVIKEFDFIEGFNACGSITGNRKSVLLSKVYDKPMFGGSDSHQLGCVGKGYTKLPGRIENADDLITMVKGMAYGGTKIGGDYFEGTMEKKHKVLHSVGIRTFYAANWCMSQYSGRVALKKVAELNLI